MTYNMGYALASYKFGLTTVALTAFGSGSEVSEQGRIDYAKSELLDPAPIMGTARETNDLARLLHRGAS